MGQRREGDRQEEELSLATMSTSSQRRQVEFRCLRTAQKGKKEMKEQGSGVRVERRLSK